MTRVLRLCTALLCSLLLANLPSTGSVGRAASPGEPVYTYDVVQFPNRSDGFVAATKSKKPYLLTTTNDGRTWSHFRFYSAGWFQFVNAKDGWVLPNGRTSLYRTTNGGRTWSRGRQLSVEGSLTIQFLSATTGFAHYNPCQGCNGITIETRNGGATWKRAHWPFKKAYWLFHFSSVNDGFVAQQTPGSDALPCRNELYYTTDGGRHWTVRDKAKICYTIPSFANRLDGWMVPWSGGRIAAWEAAATPY